MADVLLVSKPIVPPWHDSSKNLVRDLATHMQRHVPIVLSQPGVTLDMPRARVVPVYPQHVAGFAPALADNARVLRHLLVGPRAGLWHFFFAPNPKTSAVGRVAAKLRRMRTLQTVCSAPLPEVDSKRVLFADRVIVLSRHTERRFLDAGISPERLALIRPCIAALTPIDPAQRPSLRQRLGLPTAGPLVVYAGDLEFGCGADLALHAHRALPSTLCACLVMACRAKTPAAKQRLEELRARVHAWGLTKSVIFLGETSFIHDLLAAADLVTLPTDSLYAKMDMPLVLVEAMALERAVLVGMGTPAQELAEGDAAVCVATQPDAVAAETRSLLEDDVRRHAVAARGRAAAVQHYSAARMAHAYESLYDQLCA
ncbi:MAG TPA: glycosyltransferase family 4 protein [Polyangiales bacterium]